MQSCMLTGNSPNNSKTLVTNTYDIGSPSAVSGLREWDTSYANVTTRSNVTSSVTPAGTASYTYDQSGNPTAATVNGVTTQVATASSNNFAAPTSLTVGSLTSSLSWNSFLGL